MPAEQQAVAVLVGEVVGRVLVSVGVVREAQRFLQFAVELFGGEHCAHTVDYVQAVRGGAAGGGDQFIQCCCRGTLQQYLLGFRWVVGKAGA